MCLEVCGVSEIGSKISARIEKPETRQLRIGPRASMYIHEPTYLGTRLDYPDAKWRLTIKSQFNCAGPLRRRRLAR